MTAPMTFPATDLRYLKGIGPKRALALEKVGVLSPLDLLFYFPRRYEDRSSFSSIENLTPGQTTTLRGEILRVHLKPLKRMPILEIFVGDDTGTIHAIWFNQPYLKNQFAVGQKVILYGKIELYQNRLQISAPEYEIIEPDEEAVHTLRITPIYPLTEGLFQRSLRSTLRELLQNQLDRILSDYLPEAFRQEKNLLELCEAVREMHFPTSFEQLAVARRRIVFDEFFLFELTLLQKVQRMRTKYRSHTLADGKKLLEEFEQKLPFKPTQAQSRAMGELAEDLGQSYPMNRLLQGDVGSGKTAVATFAIFLAAKNQTQAALLVPTEILAEQHFRTLRELLQPFSITVGLLTSSTPEDRRDRMLAELKNNKLSVLVGTHSLLSEEVRFHSLAIVIIDEQHKFGVYQRCQLLNQEPRPHQLVMTATPIPRTLALTLYGDLQVSTLEELPVGRKPIKTYWVTRRKQEEILNHIHFKIKKGEQAYFIFPLIEETEKSDLMAAKKAYEELRRKTFADVRLGLVHGKLNHDDREIVMAAFKKGEIQVLVATSVVEVGVDNPNATIMVIENAERFGLAQLHQMRGRIGRGEKPSECFLFGEPKTTEGQKRLRILTKTQDGFLIADEDLKLRGPGDFLGARQSGAPLFRVADPIMDEGLLLEARDAAQKIIQNQALDQSAEWLSTKNFLAQMSLKY